MSDAIGSEAFYAMLTRSLQDNSTSLKSQAKDLGDLSKAYVKLETNFKNLDHNNKSKFEGIKMSHDAFEDSIKEVKKDIRDSSKNLDVRLKILEQDKLVKTRFGKFLNSPVGVRLMIAFFTIVWSFSMWETYKIESPDQKKYIKTLENQNLILKKDINNKNQK